MFGTVDIKFKGEKKTLKFNINARFLFCQMHGIGEESFADFWLDTKNVTRVRDLIFCAMLSADSQAEREINYNVYDVGEWMQDAGTEELNRVLNLGAEANAKGSDNKKKVKRPASMS